jgi:hypothetical protein
MIRAWYIPSSSGDFRLLADGDDKTTLEIVEPTPRELEVVGSYLADAVTAGWLEAGVASAPSPTGTTTFSLKSPLPDAAALLAKKNAFTPRGRITAIRSKGGQLEVTEEVSVALELAKAPDAEVATTVRRPTPCCPYTRPGPDTRASEVLREFVTRDQWAEWEKDGTITFRGQLTGHRYRVAHRHSKTAIRQGRICADLTDGFVLHFHDSLRPPAEEVLATKLILEHRESWLRNESTCLSERAREVFRNPVGHRFLDGRPDAALFSAFGGGVVGGIVGNKVGAVLGKKLIRSKPGALSLKPGARALHGSRSV